MQKSVRFFLIMSPLIERLLLPLNRGSLIDETIYSSKRANMKIEYTYWKDDDFFIGFINQYPDYETQGDTLEELKENLRDLWQDLATDMILYSRKVDELMVA